MEERIEDELATARRRMEQLNRETDIKILKQQDKEFERLGVHTYIIKKDGRYEVNDMVAQLKLYQHWTTHIVYRSSEALQEAYKELGMTVTKGYEWSIADDSAVKDALKPPQFRDRLKRFCDLKEKLSLTDNEQRELRVITDKYPFLEQGYKQLGQTLRRYRTIKEIKALIE